MVGEVNQTQEIYFNVTSQSLVHDAEYRPSAVTGVTVYEQSGGDDSSAESATTGSASIDAVNTTVDATTSSGTTTVYLTATTNIAIGRRYKLTNPAGDYEWVEVIDLTAATSVTVRHALANTYAATSTFEGTRITISVDATWVADAGNISSGQSPHPRYRVRWEYTANSVTVVAPTYLDLVRYRATHAVKALDVDAVFPGFIDALPTDYRRDQARGLIDAAYRAVRLDLFADELGFANARNAEAMDTLVLYKANELAQEVRLQRGGGTIEAVDVARSGYQQRYNTLVRSPGIKWGADSSGAAAEPNPAPLFWR